MQAVATLFLVGGLLMSAMVQEKKDEKEPRLNTTVTFKRWVGKNGPFDPNPDRDVPARKREIDGKPVWDLSVAKVTGGRPTPKSEIIDQDGKTWVVEKVSGGGTAPHICYVKEKPAEKKPE